MYYFKIIEHCTSYSTDTRQKFNSYSSMGAFIYLQIFFHIFVLSIYLNL